MKKLFTNIFLFLMMMFASPVFADAPPRITGSSQLTSLVDKVLSYLFPIAGIISVIFIIIGGYMWIVSGGDPAKVKQAQGTLTWAVLGLIFVMLILGAISLLVDFITK